MARPRRLPIRRFRPFRWLLRLLSAFLWLAFAGAWVLAQVRLDWVQRLTARPTTEDAGLPAVLSEPAWAYTLETTRSRLVVGRFACWVMPGEVNTFSRMSGPPENPGWVSQAKRVRLSGPAWQFDGLKDAGNWYVSVPYWIPCAVALLTPSAELLSRQRRRARARRGRCGECGYDLRASPARCPECGAPVLSAALVP